MFSKKIDKPLKITLDYERLRRRESTENFFTICDPIAGFVTLTLTEPQEVGKLIVRFYGTSSCSRQTPGSEGPSYRSVQPWLFMHDLSPPEINRVLEPGVHSWYFISAFPRMTDASLVQDEEEEFNVSEQGFKHEAHPLPPSCKLQTGHTSALDTKTDIWYAVDAEFTKIGGKLGKLMTPTTIRLNYVPMATGYPIEPKPKTIYTTEILECRSMGLSPVSNSSIEPGKSLSWRERVHAKLDKTSTPLHTFQLELVALDQYTIDQPMPLWIRVIHNPDGKSTFSHEQPPPVYVLESSIKYWSWNHVRGTSKWSFGDWPEGDVEDPVRWGEIAYSYKADRKEKNNDDDPTNDVLAPHTIDTFSTTGTDLTKLSGIDYTWAQTEASVPDFNTYNVQVRQAIEVEVEIMVGGKKFDVAYQRQNYKWEKWMALSKVDCVPLVCGLKTRQHDLKGKVSDEETENMEWWLIGDDPAPYTFRAHYI